MVTNADILLQVFNDDTILVKHIDEIHKLVKKYPYFQPAWAAKTRFLKIKKSYAALQLQQTAARSIDRALLLEYLEKPIIKEKTEEKREIFEKKDIKPVSVESAKPEKQKIHNKTDIEKEKQETLTVEKPTGLNLKQTVLKPEKLSYIEWLNYFNSTKTRKNKSNIDRIEKFLKERPKIVPKKNISVKAPDIIEKSVAEKQMLMTETLANLYLKQKKYEKAIQAFRILSLKYPKKSSYFANQIKEIKQKLK